MKTLIIDAAKEDVIFSIIDGSQLYTTTYVNSRENFDKFMNHLLSFLKKNRTEIKDLKKIFINQGPGKLSSIRTSISIAKAIALTKNIRLIGFDSRNLEGADYKKILELNEKNMLNKDLIKPLYSS